MIDVSTQCPSGSFVYTIRAGDTLFRLAQTNNTTVNAILRINPGLNPNALQIGQRICIPGTAPVTCPSGSFSYVIRSGDTLFALAQRFGTTVAAITALNPGIDPTGLRIGQTICIPGMAPGECPSGSFSYTIQRGDTLFALAQRFNTTVSAITALNPGIDPNSLQIGQRICIPGMAPGECPSGSFSYTIQRGDTLFALAQRFNTTVSAILALNPGLDPNSLQVGRMICIPGMAPGECPSGSFSYTIQRGDTLFVLAQRFNTTVSAILALNPGLDPNALQIGQRICIPGMAPGACPPGSTAYTIQRGDTLFALAQRFGTTVPAILALNPGLDPNALQIGQRICIPGVPPVTCPSGSFAYVIRSGDTLFALAQRFGTTTAAIIALNPNINPNALQIGQTICIPQAVPTCPGGTLYTIQTGDTLFSLATRFNISVAELQMANPGLDPNRLMVGQRICIPSSQPITCPGNNTYVIEAGETLTSIAERFMVSTSEILILNPELRPGDFIPGRTICIPMNEA